jgi:apyrase
MVADVQATDLRAGCLRAATRLLRQGELHDACESIRCGVGGMPTPRLSGEFLATENFFYTAEFFGLGSRPSLEEVAHAGEKYCAMQWNDVMHLHGPESAPGGEVTASSGRSEPELLKYCFSAAYIVAFLANGWGVDKNEKKVHFSNSVGGVSVDWAVGALLLEVCAALSQRCVPSRTSLSIRRRSTMANEHSGRRAGGTVLKHVSCGG